MGEKRTMSKAKLHIKRGDTVQVISGKEKGKSGKILKAYPAKGRVIVEHVNMIKKHTKRRSQGQGGGIIEREGTLNASNLMLVCPSCRKATRLGHKRLEDGSKARICKKCGEVVDR
jgi:large subunit ribosomal protein L24